jgi:hypothetical protein
MSLDAMLAEGRLAAVPADLKGARGLLTEARRHAVSARRIAADDPNGAYQLAYDALRKAITSDQRARGYRVANKPGAHVAVGEYAASEGILDDEGASRFDRMRRNRHRSEYELAFFEATEVERDLVYVEGVIAAVGDRLG